MDALRRYGYLVVAATGMLGLGVYLALAGDRSAAESTTPVLVVAAVAALAGAGVLLGARSGHRARWGGWLVVAGAVVLTGAGALLRPVAPAELLVSSAGYLLLLPGALLLARTHSDEPDRASVVDALIVGASAALAVAVAVGAPVGARLLSPAPGWTPPLVAARTLLGVVLVAVVALLWFREDGRPVGSLRLLAGGAAVMLVTDAVAAPLVLDGAWQAGPVSDAGRLFFVVLATVAATYPGTAEPAATRSGARQGIARFVLLLALVTLLPPLLVLGRGQPLGAGQSTVVVVGAGVLFGLTLVRMRGLVVQLRETQRREHVLRDAYAALAAAPDRPGIRAVTVAAAAEVLPGARAWWVEHGTSGQGAVAASAPSAPLRQVGPLVVDTLSRCGSSGAAVRGPSPLHAALAIPADQPAAAFDLHDEERVVGSLVVAHPTPLDGAVRTALSALTASAALAQGRVDLGRVLADRQSERRLRRMMQHASDIIAVLDLDLDLRYLSPAAERLVGTPTHYLLGKSWLDLVFPVDREPAQQLITQALGDRPSRGEVRLMSSDGSHHYVELYAARVVEDEEPGFVLTCHDVTERRALEQQLTHQAFHDSLTGLANRALFRDRLEHALTRSQRTGAPFAVLFIDLDDFKNVNDTLGHAAGDALLRQVTQRLLDAVRDQDTVARLGGDEFAVVLEDLTGEEEAIAVAERFLAAVARPFDLAGAPLASGVSIGIAVSAADTVTADDAMRNADLALYEAKNMGKNRYALFIPVMHELAVDRMQLTNDLRRAIDEHELVVHFQPIVDLGSGRTVGVEALVRWRHPQRGLMGPAQFIPLAEETGLVVPLGRDVLRQALGSTGRWRRRLPELEPLYVSVNLSARQLQQDSVVDDVRHALEESGVPPESVILEITETVLLPDEGVTLERLQALDALGVRLFIDDFGTGYSSLSYLQQLPVHGIKLAREFVATLTTDGGHAGSSAGLVATIRALAETLGLESIIAEGVETPEQRQALLGLGYRLGQGYLMARPMSADTMLQRLAEEAGRLSAVGAG